MTFEHLTIELYDPSCGSTHSAVEGCYAPFNGNTWIETHARLERALSGPRVSPKTITRLCAEVCIEMDALGMVEYDDETYANFVRQSFQRS